MNLFSRGVLSKFSSIIRRGFLESSKVKFGILFDIDGVLIKGSRAIDGAKAMFEFLTKEKLISTIPMAYLTNSCDFPVDKAKHLSSLFNVEIKEELIINAPAPLRLFTDLHAKRVLLVGQGNMKEYSKRLNFTNVVDLSDVQNSYPTLDVMDKTKRKKLKDGYVEEGMDPIEGIVIIGEPTEWQSYLQVLIDLLVTNGKPSSVPATRQTIPIYLCNLDFLYAAEAKIPRFGNGAFIHSLESLFEKLTGEKLVYSAVIGKPSEVSFRYAEYILSNFLKEGNSLERLYMIGDNPGSDILGANLYQNFIDNPDSLPLYRTVPSATVMNKQSVKNIKSFLVKTGVYGKSDEFCERHQHWTFSGLSKRLIVPTYEVNDCFEAVYRIIELENILSTIQK